MPNQPGIGHINELTVMESAAEGIYLDCSGIEPDRLGGHPAKHVLLPNGDGPATAKVGETLAVFLYADSRDRLVATTKQPNAEVGQCAYLQVKETNDYGAFLDWGVPKDLLLPFSEQAYPVSEGKSYVVYLYLDKQSGRVACSTKLHHFLEESSLWLKPGQRVELLIAGKSPMGYKAVINGTTLGLIYHEEISAPLKFGEKMPGWIKAIREDGRIDLSINTLDRETRDELSQQILAALDKNGGRLDLSDKSHPDVIFRQFRVSKKNFKRAIGSLYKQGAIRIHETHIEKV